MSSKLPPPPEEIKPFPVWIGIREGQGGADPPPPPGEPYRTPIPWYLRPLRRWL
jgi:hypothetical protein